jgi:hypothetical protein
VVPSELFPRQPPELMRRRRFLSITAYATRSGASGANGPETAIGEGRDAHYTATLNLIPSLGACTRSCFVPKYRSVVWTDAWPRSN